jgi:hypothetical protein
VKRIFSYEDRLSKCTLTLSSICATKSKTQCKVLSDVIKKLRFGSACSPQIFLILASSINRPKIDIKRLQFHAHHNLIDATMIRENKTRRWLNDCAQKSRNSPLVLTTIVTTTISLNISATISWSLVVGIVIGGLLMELLVLFQRAKRRHSNNYQDVIDRYYTSICKRY